MKAKTRDKWTMLDYNVSWGLIGTLTTLNNPIELIRFRIQVMPLLMEQGHLQSPYLSCLDCAKKIYLHQGFKSFFKGNLSNIIRVLPSETLIFQLKEYFQRHFHYHQQLSNVDHFKYNTLIGISAAMIVSLSLYPFQYIRQQLLNRTDRNGRSITHYLKKIVGQTGIRGFYKGAIGFSIGLIIFRGTYFGVYDSFKVRTKSQIERLMVSGVATYLAITACYPIDTVRRRFISSRGKYLKPKDCLKDILAKQGIKGLFLGWPMILLQSVNIATSMFIYDHLTTNYEEAIV